MSSDSKAKTRSAAYAEFEDRNTGKNFFVISVHLDDRHSGTLSKEKKLDTLRAAQVRAVYDQGERPRRQHADPLRWRHQLLEDQGRQPRAVQLHDEQGLPRLHVGRDQVDSKYPTVNHFKTTLKANAAGRQVALDVVMAKGAKGFSTYENVMKVTDSSRPSDHNMVVSDLVL